MKRTFVSFIIIFCVMLAQPFLVHAQTATDLASQLTIETIPITPGPNQETDIQIESYVFDLIRAKISWYVNGALRASGIGQKSFTFTTGGVGSTVNVKYVIETEEGVKLENTIPFSPGQVSLIWESTGYTPPFYKGKTLFSYEGTARIVAIPNLVSSNGTKYKSEQLIYTWKKGSGTDTAASGYGKNMYTFTGDIIARPTTIYVEVSNVDNSVKAEGSVDITAVSPEIYVYENSPTLGILFNKAILGRFNLLENEISFVASPFYFNNPNTEGLYTWLVNGSKSTEKTRAITFRANEDDKGYSKINIQLTNQKRILQSAENSFNIFIGETTSSN